MVTQVIWIQCLAGTLIQSLNKLVVLARCGKSRGGEILECPVARLGSKEQKCKAVFQLEFQSLLAACDRCYLHHLMHDWKMLILQGLRWFMTQYRIELGQNCSNLGSSLKVIAFNCDQYLFGLF